ncbi:hypothetical protein ACYULU_00830 [Breznakiellaceae bacterium SP9]
MKQIRPLFSLFASLILFCCVPSILYAQVPLAPDGPRQDTIDTSTDLIVQGSSKPELKVGITQSFSIPLLRFDNPLMQDNNLKIALTAELSPVSFNTIMELTLTPAAFFQAIAGGHIGVGWNNSLGSGIGMYETDPVTNIRSSSDEEPEGMFYSGWGAGRVQFDLAALIPGDWNHIVFSSQQGARYRAFSGEAARGDGVVESWVYENDKGENRNGFVYTANYLVGYLLPLSPVLNAVAVLAEVEKPLYDVPGGSVSRFHLGRWTVSSLFGFTLRSDLSLGFALQVQTRRKPKSRETDPDYYHFVFYRAALVATYTLF